VDPGKEPSNRDPTKRPFKDFAQSFAAGVHSPTTVQREELESDEPCPQAVAMCCALLIWLPLISGSQVSQVKKVIHKSATYSYGKHLIKVSVENDTLPVWRRHEPIPERNRLECVVDHDYEIALLRGSEWEALVWKASENIDYRGSVQCVPNISIAIKPILEIFSIRTKSRYSETDLLSDR
jgi:hypothetical protein